MPVIQADARGLIQVPDGRTERLDALAIVLLLGFAKVGDSQDKWKCANKLGIAIMERVELRGDLPRLGHGFGIVTLREAFDRPRKENGWFGALFRARYPKVPIASATTAANPPIAGHL